MLSKNRKFSMSYGSLYDLSMQKLQVAKRDAVEMAEFGYTTERLEALEAKANEMIRIPNDEVMLGAQMMATESKNQTATDLRKTINHMRFRVEMIFGRNSGIWRQANLRWINNPSEGDLLSYALQLIQIANENKGLLAEAGLTQEHIDKLEAQANDFSTKMNLTGNAITQRDLTTAIRHKIGNELMNEISLLARAGQRLWKGVEEARYNDYLLGTGGSNTSATSAETPDAPEAAPPDDLDALFADEQAA